MAFSVSSVLKKYLEKETEKRLEEASLKCIKFVLEYRNTPLKLRWTGWTTDPYGLLKVAHENLRLILKG